MREAADLIRGHRADVGNKFGSRSCRAPSDMTAGTEAHPWIAVVCDESTPNDGSTTAPPARLLLELTLSDCSADLESGEVERSRRPCCASRQATPRR